MRFLHRLVRPLGLAAALILSGAVASAEAPIRSDLPPPRPGTPAAAAVKVAKAAAARTPVARDLAAPIAEDFRISGRSGWALMDLETGELLEGGRADEPFPPASVAKIFTAQYALETLGADHRYETRLVAEAAPANNRVLGDVALVGGGDPSLDTDALAEMAAQARARGLQSITGRFLVDASLLPEIERIDPEQPDEEAYNPAVGALNLDFNRVLFHWQRGKAGDYALGLEARGLRARTPPSHVSIQLGETGGSVFAYESQGSAEAWAVARTALGAEGQRWLPVRRPSAHAAGVFRSLAAEGGVMLPEALPGDAPAGVVLAQRRSAPMSEILQEMLKYSTNLTAEAVGLTATQARGLPVDDLAASGAAMSAWAEARASGGAGPSAPPPEKPAIPAAGAGLFAAAPAKDGPALSAGIAATMLARSSAAQPAARAAIPDAVPRPAPAPPASGIMDLRNHSGLASRSRVTPAAMTAFLRAVSRTAQGRAAAGELAPLLKDAPLAPRKGEPKLPAGVDAVAKTGTMYFVRGLAGYITAASGRRLAFAVFSEDLERRASLADPSHASKGWLGAAREMERRMVRAWAAGY